VSTGRTLSGATGSSGSASTGPYIAPTAADLRVLLHGEGSNGGTTITDVVAGNTWTATNATTSTTKAFVGSSSISFTGASNSRISCPQNSNFNVTTNDWTVAIRVYPNAGHEAAARLFQTRDGDTYAGISISSDGAGSQTLGLYLSSNGSSHDILAAANIGTMTIGCWNSVVVMRRGPLILVWINEVLTYNTTISLSASIYYNAAHTVIIGGQSGTSRSFNAYVDEFLFMVGAMIRPIGLPLTAFPDS
jgi:hypothetical protein